MTDPNKNNRGILWQEELRKLGGEQLVSMLTQIRDAQESMNARMDNIENGIGAAIQQHISIAFAGGDAEGHRRAHETMIAMMEERRKMYASIREKTLSGLLWAAVVWGGLAILTRIKIELGLPP